MIGDGSLELYNTIDVFSEIRPKIYRLELDIGIAKVLVSMGARTG